MLGDISKDLLGALRRSGVCLSDGVDSDGTSSGRSGAAMRTSGEIAIESIFTSVFGVGGGGSTPCMLE